MKDFWLPYQLHLNLLVSVRISGLAIAEGEVLELDHSLVKLLKNLPRITRFSWIMLEQAEVMGLVDFSYVLKHPLSLPF